MQVRSAAPACVASRQRLSAAYRFTQRAVRNEEAVEDTLELEHQWRSRCIAGTLAHTTATDISHIKLHLQVECHIKTIQKKCDQQISREEAADAREPCSTDELKEADTP